MVPAWENLQEVFMMLVVVVVLPHWRFFIHCFSTSSLIFPWAIAGFLHPFYSFRPAHCKVICNTFIWTFLGFSVTVFLPVLRFWRGVFYPQAIFTLHSFPTYWHVYGTQMRAGTHHPGSPSVPALTKLSLPADAWSWTIHIVDTRPLVYQLRQWVTKLLNMFQPTYGCSKSNGKTIKTLWTRLVNKYCLKLLQRNCFLSLHQS